MKPQDKVWIDAGGRHPGILIRLSEDGKFALIFEGTGTAGRDDECIKVDHTTRMGKRLRLTKTTYFYKSNLCVRPVGEVTEDHPPATCPVAVWDPLERMALARVREDPRLAIWRVAENNATAPGDGTAASEGLAVPAKPLGHLPQVKPGEPAANVVADTLPLVDPEATVTGEERG